MSVVTVSVIVPFRDHEDKVGRACLQIAKHFRDHKQAFEIIAVDQGSGDNSRSVLALLQGELPELVVTVGGGYRAGSRVAKANVLVLVNVEHAAQTIASALCDAVARVLGGQVDMYLAAETQLVCVKARCHKLLGAGTSRRTRSERQLLERGRLRGLKVQSYGPLQPSHGHLVSRLLTSMLPSHLRIHPLW